VKNDDVMDLIVVFCILFVFMRVLYCFCVATEFSVNKDLYNIDWHSVTVCVSLVLLFRLVLTVGIGARTTGYYYYYARRQHITCTHIKNTRN